MNYSTHLPDLMHKTSIVFVRSTNIYIKIKTNIFIVVITFSATLTAATLDTNVVENPITAPFDFKNAKISYIISNISRSHNYDLII